MTHVSPAEPRGLRLLAHERLLGFGACSCVAIGIIASASSPQRAAGPSADEADALGAEVEHLGRLLLEGGEVDPLPICTSILSMILDDAQPWSAYPAENMSWQIPVSSNASWVTLRIVPEGGDKQSLDVVFSLGAPRAPDGEYTSVEQLVSINLLVGAGGPEIVHAHTQVMPHRTQALLDHLLETGPMRIGGSYRMSNGEADWGGLFLSAIEWGDGSTTWTTSLGEMEAREGRLVMTDELQFVGERVLALTDGR
jgi:hypothetical protein